MKPNIKMPAIFVGHGSPMNIIYNNSFTQSLVKLANDLPLPENILVISAHWLTRGTFLMKTDAPSQIYDFSGFPKALYDVKYPAKGNSVLAENIKKELKVDHVRTSADWGIDHGAWSVLKHMYPEANIPVIQLSIDITKPAEYHYELGKMLRFLRDQNVLVIGSGNIVHNLRIVDFDHIDGTVISWAERFDNKVKKALLAGDHKVLINYRDLPSYELAIPTPDHYLPLLYIAGMQEKGDAISFPYEGFQHATLSMRSVRVG
jgi:4,5-DOPA dioxygenase extradiol